MAIGCEFVSVFVVEPCLHYGKLAQS